MEKVLERLKEPSTWAGLSGLAIVAGLSLDEFNIYVGALTGVLAVAAIVLKEVKS